MSVWPWVLAGMVSLLLQQGSPRDPPFTIAERPAQRGAAPASHQVELTLRLNEETDAAGSVEVILVAPPDQAQAQWTLIQRQVVPMSAGRIGLSGPSGRTVVLVIRRVGQEGYLLHGPIRWPSAPETHLLDGRLCRTLRGRLPTAFTATTQFTWIPATDDRPGSVPFCQAIEPGGWECIRLEWNAIGVLVLVSNESLAAAVVESVGAETIQPVVTERAAWGRLVRFATGLIASSITSDIKVSLWSEAISQQRGRSARIRLEQDRRVAISRLSPFAVWVSGNEPPTDAELLQVEGPGIATARFPLTELSAGPVEMPFEVALAEPLTLTGRVESATGRPASDALLLVSEILQDKLSQGDGTAGVRLRRLRDGQADATGAFTFSSLGAQKYELLAIHPSMGRTRRVVAASDSPVVLRLTTPREVRGRVVRRGLPIEGVPVLVVPDLATFAASRDPIEHFSLEAATDALGRFRISVPPEGSSELRIGNGQMGVVRRPLNLARDMPPVTDLGDVELPGSIQLTALLSDWESCDLHAAGPLASSGMQIVSSARTAAGLRMFHLPEPGRWVLSLLCGSHEVTLDPPMVDVPKGRDEMTVTLIAPPQ